MLPLTSISQTSLTDPVLLSQWFAVAFSSDVPDNRMVPIKPLGQELMLWRDETGIHAWRDLCIHRGARLSLGSLQDGCVVCPYHGWRYDASGACVFIPSQPGRVPPLKARSETFHARECYGLIWVCLGTPANDLPNFVEANADGFRTLACGPYAFEAKGPRLIENFLDVGHLSIAHGGLLGTPEHAEIPEYDVLPPQGDGEGPSSGPIPLLQPNPEGTGKPGIVQYRYRVHAPLVASFNKSQGESQHAILFAITPISEESSLAWGVMALNYADSTADRELLDFQDLITGQDKPIVESQRPELLPVDLQEELHLRSDRMAIAYRIWLKSLSMIYGVA